MKEIPLTQGQVALVDDEDFERVNAFNWCATWHEDIQSFYAIGREGHGRSRKNIYMHRLIMQTPKGMVCDHINHDTLDNRENNLRNCTPSQSAMNRKTQSNNTTGFKTIYRHRKKYEMRIKVKGKIVFRKIFPTIEEAIEARDEAIKKYHGEFAWKE